MCGDERLLNIRIVAQRTYLVSKFLIDIVLKLFLFSMISACTTYKCELLSVHLLLYNLRELFVISRQFYLVVSSEHWAIRSNQGDK